MIKRILILEDNLLVLSKLLAQLEIIEQKQPFSLSLVVLTDSPQVEDYVNNNPKAIFDIVLLDRDCKLNGSFHNLDFDRIGPEKIISISTVPEYNKDAQKKGVKRHVVKDLSDLDTFASNVANQVEEMIDDKSKIHWSKKWLKLMKK